MDSVALPLPPETAWDPLPADHFTPEAAAHLLRRLGFSAPPDQVRRAAAQGLPATLDAAFPDPALMPVPPALQELDNAGRYLASRNAESPLERQRLQAEIRRANQDAMGAYEIAWLNFARQPANSPREKFVLFLQDVLVVTLQKVKNAEQLFQHQQLLRAHLDKPYPDLCKAVSRSPAMIRFLDLDQSKEDRPNENFARELFELFILGEGRGYTEKDIKEAARAFTGYRALGDRSFVVDRQRDTGRKTVFGRSGNWSGDDVIDLAFAQPAAATFLPREFCLYYLAHDPLPDPWLETLGQRWRAAGFRLDALARLVFYSRLFFHQDFRGNLIKSPVQFVLGLLQEMSLDVPPIPARVSPVFRNLGQPFFNPPNVRGWVGGKAWINSSTLTARRQVVASCFEPLDYQKLNADEYVEVMAAEVNGRGRFAVPPERLSGLLALPPAERLDRLASWFLAAPLDSPVRQTLLDYLAAGPAADQADRTRDVVVTLLQSPSYHLC